jgi:putative sterol carrier protein
MEKPNSIAEVMQKLPEAFLAAKAGNAKAVVQFNLSGEGGGTYTVTIGDGKCQVAEGPATAPTTAIVTAAAADYLAIARNELNAVSAFMGGKLKIAGDMSLMMRFMDWFAKP